MYLLKHSICTENGEIISVQLNAISQEAMAIRESPGSRNPRSSCHTTTIVPLPSPLISNTTVCFQIYFKLSISGIM